ncbi:hypothetical protein N431DRAFT_446450 [Stipitochalara longipes BDJ]|nr:hypothetical protein N431DRAFT_446450 [Stipitochalara longipes BDJ]
MGTPAPTPIPNAYNIPGAILFMTITFKEGATVGKVTILKDQQDMNIVAYDPKLMSTETLNAIKLRYSNETLPYFERFSAPGEAPALFQTAGPGGVYFVGTFGAKDKLYSPKSIPWANAVSGDSVLHGLTLVYWNQKVNAKTINQGMFTAPARGHFLANAKPSLMAVRPGPGASVNVAAQGILNLLEAEKLVLHYYATAGDENVNLRPTT